MADNIRHIPERFGEVQQVWHPRITSMGRRLLACLPPALLGVMCLAVLWLRRPAPAISAIIAVIVLACVGLCWLWLRPSMVAVTRSHVLGSRIVGFHKAQRSEIEQAVLVEALERPGQASAGRDGKPRRRGLTRPYLWLVDDGGRRLFRLDGTVWDVRSLNQLADYLGVPVQKVPRTTPKNLARSWPRIVGPLMRYPWIRSVSSGAVLIATVAVVYWLAWQ
ncbi:hypothetical protein FCK90_02920 [Kocuria coralli]|uniref:PH domain-containing protein n=1 Tax=Kocuria coralli TaxID=1461025 RepID=A0A5J5L1A7_9MICC|nr:hypothetical protein [Kocuria coralli]KAA9395368.1 hypothetical protein FCK90_02920 [Kocuria coralli]